MVAMRRLAVSLVTVLGLLGWVTASSGATTVIPLPRGVARLPEPTQVDVGAGTVYVQAFSVTMKEDALVAFYEQALPRAGWRLEKLPWQADQDKAVHGLKRALAYYGKAMDEPQRQQVEARLARLEEGAQVMRSQLYATNGLEHVLINLWPLEDAKGTTVFLNRWSGSRHWLTGGGDSGRRTQDAQGSRLKALGNSLQPPASSLEPAGASSLEPSGLPMTNVCCTGEEVPDLQAVLPFSVPKYPGAKAVARTTPPGGVSTTVLLLVSAQQPDVLAYYEQEMPKMGWKRLDEGQAADGATVSRLHFQRPDRVCELTFAEAASKEPDSGETKTLVTVAVRPRTQGAR